MDLTEGMKQQTQALASELENTFEVLRGCCGAPDALTYFFRLAEGYFGLLGTDRRREALILGDSFPEELLWANRIFPHWVIGGGFSVGSAIDSRVPRDADWISRSMLGYVENYLEETDKKTPVIIPIIGDNQRKIAYLLREEGRNVIPIDITPEAEPSRLYPSLTEQLGVIMGDMALAWHMPGQAGKLRRAIRETERAKAAALGLAGEPAVSGMLKMFLLNTYFYAGDLTEWAQNIDRLATELKSRAYRDKEAPGVLIIGSPVLFPNYKVPALLESCGLSILGACDCVSGKVLSAGTKRIRGGRRALLHGLVERTYGNDCSGAFVSNYALYGQASHLLDTLDVQGVIFHIIKGQIEYDFELERMERLFSAHKLPVFRLETDYHDNDVEQLRIRLEAFAELLTQDAVNHEKSSE